MGPRYEEGLRPATPAHLAFPTGRIIISIVVLPVGNEGLAQAAILTEESEGKFRFDEGLVRDKVLPQGRGRGNCGGGVSLRARLRLCLLSRRHCSGANFFEKGLRGVFVA